MSAAACKIIINGGLRADGVSLMTRVEQFEALVKDPGFAKLPKHEQDAAFNAAIAIDREAVAALRKAQAAYEALTLKIAETVP